MDNRDELNMIVFFCGDNDETVHAGVPVFADDGFAQAWRVIQHPGITAESVTAVAAWWEPTDTDRAFLQHNFPNLHETTAVFPRPEPDGWDEALATARRLMDKTQELLSEQELEQQAQQVAEDVASLHDRVAIPMLRTTSEPPLPIASRALIPGRLYVTVARVAPTPRGTLNMLWVLENHFRDTETTFDEVLHEANESLSAGLKLEHGATADGSEAVVLKGIDITHMAAAAVAFPNFTERMGKILGGERFVVGIPCNDHLYVAKPDTGAAADLVTLVREPHGCSADLIPTILLVEPAGMEILRQFPVQ